MQIMPGTADYIAHKSGGTAFVQGDLAELQINIAYGSWYMRYLSSTTTATPCSRSPPTTPARGRSTSGGRARPNAAAPMRRPHPFSETRDYVAKVPAARRAYRREYARVGL